ncbi:MAG: hypothetical protein ACRYFU_02445 [Janthinobacterium lividum]
MADPMGSEASWPEAMAEVTECRYDVRAGRAIAFGLPSKKHFRITYNYRVGDDLHFGECYSEKARPQGSLFPIHYDPDLPHVNRAPFAGTPQRLPLLAIGIAGSIVLSFAWLLFMHGCG